MTQPSSTKPAATPSPSAKPDEPRKIESALDEKQLETVTGGKASNVLSQACATGHHIKNTTITN